MCDLKNDQQLKYVGKLNDFSDEVASLLNAKSELQSKMAAVKQAQGLDNLVDKRKLWHEQARARLRYNVEVERLAHSLNTEFSLSQKRMALDQLSSLLDSGVQPADEDESDNSSADSSYEVFERLTGEDLDEE